MQKLVLIVALLTASVFSVWGLPRIFDSQRFSVPFEGLTSSPDRKTSTGIALLPGRSTTIDGYTYDTGGFIYCLHWQANHGRSSVEITAEIKENNRWIHVVPEPLCIRNMHYRIGLKNLSNQAQFVRLRLVASGSTKMAGYGFLGLGRNYYPPPLDRIDNYPTIPEVRAEGTKYILYAGIFGGIALLSVLPISVILGVLYELVRVWSPTKRAQVVKAEVKRATSGNNFQTEVTKGYDAPPANSFRRKQDADDMKDIAAELAEKTAQLNRRAEQIEGKARAQIQLKEQLTREYEDSVRRLKAAQERLEREGGIK